MESYARRHRRSQLRRWRRSDLKDKCLAYKGNGCQRCGYSSCTAALSFHHDDPSSKDFEISRYSGSFEDLKQELDKCLLLCSNCHIEMHYSMRIEQQSENLEIDNLVLEDNTLD